MTSPDRPTRPGLDIACALSTVTTGERNTAKAAVLEHRIEAVAELIASHAGDEWAAHPATDALAAILWPKSKPATAPAEPQPTERCGETTIGMYGRLLGPCLHPLGHPTEMFHRDSHGAEWYEYDHTEPVPAASAATQGELRVLRLCVAAALSQHFLIHREDQQPQCCTEAVLSVWTSKEGRQ